MTFWQFVNNNLKTIIFCLFIGCLFVTGAYHVQDFINIIERGFINFSERK